VVTVLAPVAAAVGRLHRVGTVHGDLSPGNVLLDLDGRPSLADLGTARVVGEEPSAVWGTDGYLAPEVLMGGRPTPAADVYALGALGWLCLTGEPPGAPGLRPALADVCRAGAAGPLVEVVESAVAPHPEHRPSASALAWALFGAAEALPLHLVEGDDDVSAVTYRLRAVASRPLDEDPPAGRGRHARGPRGRPGPRPWLAGLAVVAGSVVLGVGVAVAVDLAGGAAAEPTTATPPRPAASPAPVAGATHSRTQAGGDPTTVRDAPSARPAALLEALARARAEAWRSGDPALLRGAESPGSPLLARDTAALEELARAGLRYEGLRYVVTDVAAQSQRGTSASVLARLGIDEYEVVGTGRPRPRPAVEGEEVLVELEWSGGRWRLATVRSPA
jgi:hypothetical protein